MTEDKGIPDADALHEYLAFGCLTLALRSFATLYHRFIILNTHERITYPKENMSSTALKLGLTSKMLCHVFIQLLVKQSVNTIEPQIPNHTSYMTQMDDILAHRWTTYLHSNTRLLSNDA
jgi:hypothetical protein